ncbi:hypothetical protein A9Q79_09160 [Methylophaga sp. 42_25_T18]|nr:hypothetical protein A9Q79_09160 [Methylophaga sp. 42_25_T18]OUR86004.1 hypothetical protein A9Q92_06790 [Methylophaga sp. 42_8_T64]
MEIGASDKTLERVMAYVIKPLVFYVSAGMCWVWLESVEEFGFPNSIFLACIVVLAIHWSFAAPVYQTRFRYRVLVYFIPIFLGLCGLVTWYVKYQI